VVGRAGQRLPASGVPARRRRRGTLLAVRQGSSTSRPAPTIAYVSGCDAALLSRAHVDLMLSWLERHPALDAIVPRSGDLLEPLAGAHARRPGAGRLS